MNSFFNHWRRKAGFVAICFVVIAFTSGIAKSYRKWTYPYGWSHCCIIQMKDGLEYYAQVNNGRFPAGETCPEASLGLIYRVHGVDGNTLRGMTAPEEVVVSLLNRGEKLGPDSCGWHYVEGLTIADNPSLAMLWCKLPLTHNGARSGDGGREVVYLSGAIDWISGDKWPEFLRVQADLMNQRNTREIEGLPLVTGIIELVDGSRIDHVEGRYVLEELSKWPSGASNRQDSGTELTPSKLNLYRAPFQNGTLTRTLSFSAMVSAPVTIKFNEGEPDVTNAVFKMSVKE